MKNKTKGKVLLAVALVILLITPYFMFPESDEIGRYFFRAGYNILRNITISLVISLIGIRYYFMD